ncbi:MAG: glycosyltransferase family 4 protein [Bdellovibrio sp.]|nr:glycosyltransferase family 4 protein [Bdellovibrio sp.]
MVKVIQGTVSPGFGGLELVIIEFHEWLINHKIESYVIAVEGTPLEKNLLRRGFRQSTISIPNIKQNEIRDWRLRLDGEDVAFLFHRHQGLKQLMFVKPKAKVSAMSHTFYDVKKRDLWHRFVFSKVDQWVALTPLHRDNLVETTGAPLEKICVIPNGVNLNKFEPHFKPIPNKDVAVKIGIVARVDRQKGQEIAIRALKKLVDEKSRRWTLHLFGEDTPSETPIRPQLASLAAELGIADNVIFEGFQENVGEKIQNLDLIWMPSYKETFGRCIIEGMASGIPVIASNAGGVPDIIQPKKNGLLFETKNPDDLFEKTLSLINDPVLFSAIQKQARFDVEQRYNVDEIWSRLFECISPGNIKIT